MKSGKKPVKNSNNHTDKDSHKKQILKVLKEKFRGISTTSELADEIGISWNTAEKYLLELTLDGHVQRMKKTGVNLWILGELESNIVGGGN
jgi:Mn-dependent DtxR family transcriptional regulator